MDGDAYLCLEEWASRAQGSPQALLGRDNNRDRPARMATGPVPVVVIGSSWLLGKQTWATMINFRTPGRCASSD
ncbi:hypothetical protein PoB_004802800 [Plakobranchus ocellatus]|uniref:Uncharacterized protein n=1 Tax=Plakobranchus ocellatus TaxID=259542 RepID=A0AAV4BRR6_9GAST|nr:hypothetical protein PoB_004802800 [Plakobranchus ocellatus]